MIIKSTGALLPLAALSTGQTIASDMASRGNLPDKPCHVSSNNLNKHVVSKTRASGDFQYPPGRSPAESFVVRLENYHATAAGKIVTLTFRETEEMVFPGYLKITGVNADRLDIILLDIDGSSLPKPGVSHSKDQGEKVTRNSLESPFDTYDVAMSEALRTKSVIPGDYEITAAFELAYRQQNSRIGYFR